MAGMTSNVRIVSETSPPHIGAAMRLATSEPTPLSSKIGKRPNTFVITVINMGRTRCAPASRDAASS